MGKVDVSVCKANMRVSKASTAIVRALFGISSNLFKIFLDILPNKKQHSILHQIRLLYTCKTKLEFAFRLPQVSYFKILISFWHFLCILNIWLLNISLLSIVMPKSVLLFLIGIYWLLIKYHLLFLSDTFLLEDIITLLLVVFT